MQLSELKLVTASNIIKLRTGRGLTQAELGAMLNYSDKTISKWERGEAIPDAYVLTQIAEIFGVTVDSLLSTETHWQPPEEEKKPELSYSIDVIIAIAVIGVWTLALTAFVALWLLLGADLQVSPDKIPAVCGGSLCAEPLCDGLSALFPRQPLADLSDRHFGGGHRVFEFPGPPPSAAQSRQSGGEGGRKAPLIPDSTNRRVNPSPGRPRPTGAFFM